MLTRNEWSIARRNAWIVAAWFVVGGCYASAPPLDEGESGTRLRRELWRTEAGEDTFIRWHDRDLDAGCHFMKAADGILRCLPGDQMWSHLFLDADCTAQPVIPARCAEGGFRTRAIAPLLCGGRVGRVEVLEVDDEVIAAERLFMLRDGECVSVDGVGVRPLAPVDPARFVAGEIVRDDDRGGPLAYDRLHAEDGAVQLLVPRDRARDTPCQLARVRNADRMACLPPHPLDIIPGGADCEQRWALSPSPAECGSPELAYGFTMNECGAQLALEVYRLGAPVPEAERTRGDFCTGIALEGEVLRTERDDDAVPWLRRSERGTGRLRPTVWVDDEGRALRLDHSYFDTALDTHCHPVTTASGRRCVPEDAAAGHRALPHFADDACMQPALARAVSCDPPTFVSLHGETDGCLPGLEAVYRIGAPIETIYSRHAETGACQRLPGTMGFVLEPVPLESLAPLERVIE